MIDVSDPSKASMCHHQHHQSFCIAILSILQGAQASSYSILYPYLAWTPCSHVHINAFDWQCKRRRRVSRRKEAKPEKKCLGLFLARYNLPSFKASASEPMTLNCQAMPFRE